jgi:porin
MKTTLHFIGMMTLIVLLGELAPASPAHAADDQSMLRGDDAPVSLTASGHETLAKGGDSDPPTRFNSKPLRCPTPANPYKRTQECWDEPFDMIADTMTGDWNGIRKSLQEFGITPIMSYLTNIMGNTSGASSSRLQYAGQFNASVTLDFERLVRIPGLSMVATGSWGTGNDLSKRLYNRFSVMNAYEGTDIWLAQCYLQKKLLDGNLTIAAGRMGQADIFAALPIFGNYLNAGFNGNPYSLLINHPSFAEPPPGTEWGAQATYNPTPHWQVSVGVYNTNHDSAAATDHGVNFAFQQGNYGAMFLGQISYMHNQGPGDQGLVGMYTVGGLYDGSRFTSLSTGGTTTGNWNLYAMFQQMVYREGEPGSSQGLTVWSEVTYTSKQYLNPMPLLLGAGLSYQGLVPGRPDDITSVGWLYGKMSRYISNTTAEQVIEVNYQITLKNWLSITPDFQYILNPGGYVGPSGIPNAAVFGAQVSITF